MPKTQISIKSEMIAILGAFRERGQFCTMNNIYESDLREIIYKFFPLYDEIDSVNQKIIYDSYKEFFEKALSYSFEEARNGNSPSYINWKQTS